MEREEAAMVLCLDAHGQGQEHSSSYGLNVGRSSKWCPRLASHILNRRGMNMLLSTTL